MPGRVFPIASDSNHHILFTVQQISNGRGISTGWKGMFPKNPAGGFIKGTNFFISGGGDKEDVSCRQGRPPKFRVPVYRMPRSTSFGYSPSGTFQRISPWLRSTALSVPHGGAIAGPFLIREKRIDLGIARGARIR